MLVECDGINDNKLKFNLVYVVINNFCDDQMAKLHIIVFAENYYALVHRL